MLGNLINEYGWSLILKTHGILTTLFLKFIHSDIKEGLDKILF